MHTQVLVHRHFRKVIGAPLRNSWNKRSDSVSLWFLSLILGSYRKHHTIKRDGFNELDGVVVNTTYTSYHLIFPSHIVGELSPLRKLHFEGVLRNRHANRSTGLTAENLYECCIGAGPVDDRRSIARSSLGPAWTPGFDWPLDRLGLGSPNLTGVGFGPPNWVGPASCVGGHSGSRLVRQAAWWVARLRLLTAKLWSQNFPLHN
jgi:hypothetical protein